MQNDNFWVGECRSISDLEDIIGLQAKNTPALLNKNEMEKEGFITVVHDLNLLGEMNFPIPHTIAKKENELAGYALVMDPKFKERIPVLAPMFQQIERLAYKGQSLTVAPYVVMGQICIAKEFRGQGLFKELYNNLKKRLKGHYQLLITEVSARNERSLNAHKSVGFNNLYSFSVEGGDDWELVYLEL